MMDNDWGKGCITFVILMVIGYVIIGAIGGTIKTEVTVNPTFTPQYAETTTFEESMTSHHFLYGLVTGNQPDTSEVLDKYLDSGDKLAELTVTTKFTWLNLLISTVTLGIYIPTTVDIKGTIIKSP